MTSDPIRQRYELIAGHLNERQRRLWAGTEARVLGWGGIGCKVLRLSCFYIKN